MAPGIVSYGTGEVRFVNKADDRGFVVVRAMPALAKGPKYLIFPNHSRIGARRLYSTRSESTELATVQEHSSTLLPQKKVTTDESVIKTSLDVKKTGSEDLKLLAKHWKICYSNSERIFGDLRGLLKQECI